MWKKANCFTAYVLNNLPHASNVAVVVIHILCKKKKKKKMQKENIVDNFLK